MWFSSGRSTVGAVALHDAQLAIAHREPAVAALEAHRLELRQRAVAIGQAQHHVVEVELDAVALDQRQRNPAGPLEARHAVLGHDSAFGQARDRGVEVPHAQGDVLDRAALARPVRVEQRQLAELGVDAHEREGVGLLDHVHAEVVAEEGRQRLALVYPERHVVQALGADLA